MLSLLNFTRADVLALFGLQQFTASFFFEIIDMIIMALAIGYIFSDVLRKPVTENFDPLKFYKHGKWENVKFAALAAGPAVILHELSHKAIAMLFGAKAVLFAPYGFYALIIILKAVGFPFLFFVGGFVSHTPLPPLPSALVSIAGPAMNFLLWYLAIQAVKNKWVKSKYVPYLIPFAKINLFLGIFNLIPLPGFDGFGFITSLFSFLF
ncbi:M50 family metallopeptidase [Candidatus Woesearchaeota archaeon]|nr:M50 family metallopeptidase [Candidatus Woesearchaeota archaeon]